MERGWLTGSLGMVWSTGIRRSPVQPWQRPMRHRGLYQGNMLYEVRHHTSPEEPASLRLSSLKGSKPHRTDVVVADNEVSQRPSRLLGPIRTFSPHTLYSLVG
jgi:hypothetical protein